MKKLFWLLIFIGIVIDKKLVASFQTTILVICVHDIFRSWLVGQSAVHLLLLVYDLLKFTHLGGKWRSMLLNTFKIAIIKLHLNALVLFSKSEIDIFWPSQTEVERNMNLDFFFRKFFNLHFDSFFYDISESIALVRFHVLQICFWEFDHTLVHSDILRDIGPRSSRHVNNSFDNLWIFMYNINRQDSSFGYFPVFCQSSFGIVLFIKI